MRLGLAACLGVLFSSLLGCSQPAEEVPEKVVEVVSEPVTRGWGPSINGRYTEPNSAYTDGREADSFMFCTIKFSGNGWNEPLGFGWPTDYPNAGYYLMEAIGERTSIEIARLANGEPEQTTLNLKDKGLKDFPIVFMSDVGTAGFSKEEALALRAYLLGGGFLHADDFWGRRAWKNWEYEIGQVLPSDTYSIREIPADHPVLHTPFEVGDVPQIPSAQYWSGSGGKFGTSERGAESRTAHLRGIWDSHGRLMVVMSYNTDLADSWEYRVEDDTDEVSVEYFERFTEGGGIALGINIVSYALEH